MFLKNLIFVQKSFGNKLRVRTVNNDIGSYNLRAILSVD